MSRKKKIDTRMQQLQLTYMQLAHYLLLSNRELYLWIDNKTELPYEKVLKICDLLNLDINDVQEVL